MISSYYLWPLMVIRMAEMLHILLIQDINIFLVQENVDQQFLYLLQ